MLIFYVQHEDAVYVNTAVYNKVKLIGPCNYIMYTYVHVEDFRTSSPKYNANAKKSYDPSTPIGKEIAFAIVYMSIKINGSIYNCNRRQNYFYVSTYPCDRSMVY